MAPGQAYLGTWAVRRTQVSQKMGHTLMRGRRSAVAVLITFTATASHSQSSSRRGRIDQCVHATKDQRFRHTGSGQCQDLSRAAHDDRLDEGWAARRDRLIAALRRAAASPRFCEVIIGWFCIQSEA